MVNKGAQVKWLYIIGDLYFFKHLIVVLESPNIIQIHNNGMWD